MRESETIDAKLLKKLEDKKYRRQYGLCILEGEKIIKDNLDKVVKVFLNEKNSLKNYSGRVAVAQIPMPAVPTIPFLVLDCIQDPTNMGAILRSAFAFGFRTVYCINCVDQYSSKVIRASAGYCLRLNIINCNYQDIPNEKLFVAGFNGKEVKGFSQINNLVLGNEGNGVSAEILSKSHEIISIPMNEGCESLNVSVAGAIIMYYNKVSS
ncbi:MAG: RNA methyltransferase [Christensenellaceae bacterium]|jgi:TrmH family RNA methyltransferase|nr:RNA methyltransferase [Christensenellaceae bacterium]